MTIYEYYRLYVMLLIVLKGDMFWMRQKSHDKKYFVILYLCYSIITDLGYFFMRKIHLFITLWYSIYIIIVL